MSLNKFTDTKIKEWMDIGCDQIACNELSVAQLTSGQINVVNDSPTSAVYLKMTNNDLPPDSRTYGFYSSVPSDACWFSKFSDIGGANTNYVCYEGGGGITIPTATLRINAGGLNLNNAGSLANVPSSASTGSFYEVFSSSGNQWSGAIPATGAEFKAVRVGSNINIYISNFATAATVATTMTSSVALPANFRPASSVNMLLIMEDNSVFGTGILRVETTGLMTLYANANFGAFAGAGTTGCPRTCVSYVV